MGSDQVSPLSAETSISRSPPGGHASPPSPTYCTTTGMVGNAFDKPRCGWVGHESCNRQLGFVHVAPALAFSLLPGELFEALGVQCSRVRAYLALRGAGATEEHVDHVSLHMDVGAPEGARGAGLDEPGWTKVGAAVIGERPVGCLLEAALVPGRRSLHRQMPKNHIRVRHACKKSRNLCAPSSLRTAH